MAAELINVGLTSYGLVDQMAADQRARVANLPTPSKLAVILGNPAPDNYSYGMQAVTHGENIDAPVDMYVPVGGRFEAVESAEHLRYLRKRKEIVAPDNDDAAIRILADLNEDPDVDGILPLFPSITDQGKETMRHLIDPRKDVDGVSPDRLVTPATPEAMVRLAEFILKRNITQVNPDEIVVVGSGDLVCGPLVEEVLRKQHGLEPGTFLRNKEEITAGLAALRTEAKQREDARQAEGAEAQIPRVIFSAIPVGGIIRLENVPFGTHIIDAGYGYNRRTEAMSGNADPEILAVGGLRQIYTTTFRGGVGLVTVALTQERALLNREERHKFALAT